MRQVLRNSSFKLLVLIPTDNKDVNLNYGVRLSLYLGKYNFKIILTVAMFFTSLGGNGTSRWIYRIKQGRYLFITPYWFYLFSK